MILWSDINWVWNAENTAATADIDDGAADASMWLVKTAEDEKGSWFYKASAPGFRPTERDTYSVESAKEYVFRYLRNVDFHRLGMAVLKELGPAWAQETRETEDVNDRVYYGPDQYLSLVNAADGAILRFSFSHDNKMLSIGAGHVNHAAEKHARRDERVSSINVSVNKTPAQIVADIKRRLLPGLTKMIAVVNERLTEANSHVALTTATADRVAKSIGTTTQPLSRYRSEDGSVREVSLYHVKALGESSSGSLSVSGDRITFEHLTVSGDEAIAMLAALKAARKGKK